MSVGVGFVRDTLVPAARLAVERLVAVALPVPGVSGMPAQVGPGGVQLVGIVLVALVLPVLVFLLLRAFSERLLDWLADVLTTDGLDRTRRSVAMDEPDLVGDTDREWADAWASLPDHPRVSETARATDTGLLTPTLPEYAVTVGDRHALARLVVTATEGAEPVPSVPVHDPVVESVDYRTNRHRRTVIEVPLEVTRPGAGFELTPDGDRTNAGRTAVTLPDEVRERLGSLDRLGTVRVDGGRGTVEHDLGGPGAVPSPEGLVAQAEALIAVAEAVETAVRDDADRYATTGPTRAETDVDT